MHHVAVATAMQDCNPVLHVPFVVSFLLTEAAKFLMGAEF
jgi:hypothetical protein